HRPDRGDQGGRQAAHGRALRPARRGCRGTRRLRLPAARRPAGLRRVQVSWLFNEQTADVALRTLRIGVEATGAPAGGGVPAGGARGRGRSRGRGAGVRAFSAGGRLPPVALGYILWLLMWPDSQWGGGPLGGLGWIYTLDAVILCQALLALPVIVALT